MGSEPHSFDVSALDHTAPVTLAHAADFAVGNLRVEPARLRVASPGGREEPVEPLVMQALIALAAQPGATLSRDDLIQVCWNGRIVTDDALNRVMSRLRRTLEHLPEAGVGIETVPKVGYRLALSPVTADEALAVESQIAVALQGSQPSRPPLLKLAGISLAAMLAGGLAIGWPGAAANAIVIGVEPAAAQARDPAAASFASDVTNDLARLSETVEAVTLIDQATKGSRPHMIVKVAIAREDGALAARARLVDTRSAAILWSRTYREKTGDPARLREQTSAGLGELISCSLQRGLGNSKDVDSLRLFLTACDALAANDRERALVATRQLVARQPDAAGGWACLAIVTLESAFERDAGPQRDALVIEARRLADRAMRLDSTLPIALKAVALLPVDSEQTALAAVQRALAAAPEDRAMNSFYATKLFGLGYVRDSIEPALRGLALAPGSRTAHAVATRRLLSAGETRLALELHERMKRAWPTAEEVIYNERLLLIRSPDPAAALKTFEMLAEHKTQGLALIEAELRYRAAPASLDLAELDAEAERTVRTEPVAAWYLAAVFTRLGQHDRALAWLARAPRRDAMQQWSLLFWPEVAPLRRDRRFFAAMAELGLVDIWRARDQWPDFCSEPGLTYDCRAEAAKLAKASTT